jgi:hypothetical protein
LIVSANMDAVGNRVFVIMASSPFLPCETNLPRLEPASIRFVNRVTQHWN